MDLQGTPIGKSTTGTKVSTDPSSYNPVQEGPGPITNDSLAAESVRQGGTFAQNPDSQPLGVSGGQSTFNNTNTSGATTLSSAPQSGDRENLNSQERYPEALGGQGDYPGAHLPESGYAGGSTRAKKELGIGTHQYNTQEREAAVAGGSAHNGGTAASYVTNATQNLGNTKPHGTKIHEGGFFDSDRKNASFTSEIGSNKDPGRLAENKIQRTNAESGANAAYPNPTVDANQPYAVLGSDQRA